MFPDSSGAKTPVVPSASDPSEKDEVADVIAPGSPRTDGSAVTPPEPHWDSVIGAATD